MMTYRLVGTTPFQNQSCVIVNGAIMDKFNEDWIKIQVFAKNMHLNISSAEVVDICRGLKVIVSRNMFCHNYHIIIVPT